MKQVLDPQNLLPSDWLLASLVALLPLMKPPVDYPIVLPDLFFPILAAALILELARRQRRLERHAIFAVLVAYLATQLPSLLNTSDLAQSAERLVGELYLVGLATAMTVSVTNECRLQRVAVAWLAATVALAVLSTASLAAFAIDPSSSLYRYSEFHSGTLPARHYPRLELSFLNANMACNYLTASLGVLLVAWHQRWLSNVMGGFVLAAILVAALPTLSPGLGGIALSLGVGAWLKKRSRAALFASIALAAAFVLALAFTPIPHATAPFLIKMPRISMVLAPSARFLTWGAALSEFLRHPLLGHGIGVPVGSVHYVAPSGELQLLTDAHNTMLSIAAQTGVVGLCGLAVLLTYAFRLAFSGNMAARLLAFTFLNGFVYQGLGGSFENARHLWIILGLAAAANRLPLRPADGNNRTADAPSPC